MSLGDIPTQRERIFRALKSTIQTLISGKLWVIFQVPCGPMDVFVCIMSDWICRNDQAITVLGGSRKKNAGFGVPCLLLWPGT